MDLAAQQSINQQISAELAEVMVPLAMILEMSGVSIQQMTDAYKYGLVQATRQVLRKELGAEPTKSRVALACGMSRPVVNRYFDSKRQPEDTSMPLSTQVAHRWKSGKRWRDDRGITLDLPFSGIRSFSELCASVSKKVRPRTFLDELESAGVVSTLENGCVHLEKVTTVNYAKGDRITGTLRNMRHFLTTLAANLAIPNSHYEQLIGTNQIPPNRADQIQLQVRQKLRGFVASEIIPLLAGAEVEGEDFDYLAVGLFQAVEPGNG